jgi:hypothetical protein
MGAAVHADDVRLIGFVPEEFRSEQKVARVFREAFLAVLQNEIASRWGRAVHWYWY